jgi:hypothetical protein
MAKVDAVTAARKALEGAEAAALAEGKRLAKARAEAESYAAEAATVDPDDAHAFEAASKRLAELRARADILVTREAGARDRAGAARTALAEAANAANLAALEVLQAGMIADEREALERLRAAFRVFATDAAGISEAFGRAHRLAAELAAAGIAAKARQPMIVAWAGGTPAQIARAAAESHGWRD